ncbi:hypothetical protein [Olleya sp. ITB9]|uniref:hypothetical protein n=1 Tax=Olleya sp. ITB9 TaxID=1715648 RepID=UPI0006D2026D|nr:hypothetical protein [Olleya sp. ITB9]
MNWKNTYNISIVILISLTVLFIKNIFNNYFFYGYLRNLFNVIEIIVFFGFIKTLDNSIKAKTKDKKLHIFEYALYVVIVIKILSTLITLYYIAQAPRLLTQFFVILTLSLNVALIYLSFNAFKIRKQLLGNYTNNGNLKENSFDIESLERKKYTTNSERLSLCKICINKTFDPKIGLLCNIDYSKPSFNTFCKEFIVDEKEQERIIENTTVEKKGFFGSWKGPVIMSILGFIRAAIRGFEDPFGLVFLVLGISWLVIALTSKK